ncbi:MAG: cell wall hydrolase [Pseudomonadota bacterium]|nr:cell wall hydrolase [Pseudomonadota bacterium]
MKGAVAGGVLAISIVVAAQAEGGDAGAADAPVKTSEQAPDWSAWTRPLAPPIKQAGGTARPSQEPTRQTRAEDIDVVDARWMALTMWGEARGGGEAAMRAVGHVIDNRRRAGVHSRYVTDTVSEAFQFSCWNPGDPNRTAMMNIDSLAPNSEDYRMWRLARRLAEEILSGGSRDPTGGALFYHTAAVAPRWSAGVAPTAQIGSHLFFRTAR